MLPSQTSVIAGVLKLSIPCASYKCQRGSCRQAAASSSAGKSVALGRFWVSCRNQESVEEGREVAARFQIGSQTGAVLAEPRIA